MNWFYKKKKSVLFLISSKKHLKGREERQQTLQLKNYKKSKLRYSNKTETANKTSCKLQLITCEKTYPFEEYNNYRS